MSDEILKFLNSRDIDCVLVDGTIRIGSLEHFRQREGAAWIADADEATTHVYLDGRRSLTGPSSGVGSEPWSPVAGQGAIQLSAGVKGTIEDTGFSYRHPECFVFCASIGEPEILIQSMCRDAEEPYDACVEIKLPMGLLTDRIFRKGRVRELNTPVKSVFRKPTFGRVTYDSVVEKAGNQPASLPSPFRKRPVFKSQSEIRILFVPRIPINQEYLTIELPSPRQMFAERFRALPESLDRTQLLHQVAPAASASDIA